ncbi:MAG TPA: hypothetical protein PLU71_01470 [Candidatus Dependentiae bacterium]|nr:hypothetical protein [Candidatus Dependentiae bacterium]HRQ62501.1 hypothetical protein [Candidatus Dependentiae bacterium]
MEIWKAWIPEVKMPTFKFLHYMGCRITEKGLVINLEDEDESSRKITVSFLDGYLSNRETDEGGIYDTLCDIYAYANEEKWKTANFLKVENSNYVQWFKDQNFGKYKDVEISHYMIIAFDVISEILSTGTPKIEISEWR